MARDGSWQNGGLKKKQSPLSSKAQSLGRASHKGKGNKKIVKNGRQTVLANHNKHMSSRQILDIHEREARTRRRPHQPLLSQYKTKWVRGKRAWFGGGERGKTYFEVPTRALLGEVFCQDGIPPKRSKLELGPLGACHEGQGERRHPYHSRKGYHGRQTNKIVFFCLAMGSGTQMDQWWSASTPRPYKGC